MRHYAYAMLAAAWLVWLLPFVLAARAVEPPCEVDHRARWGLRLEGVGYFILWTGSLWQRPVEAWRIGAAGFLLACAGLLSWTGTRALGRHWRIEAGLNAEHELVMCGPYRIVRHPIYTSMLCMLCGTGLVLTPWLPLLAAVAVFLIGTEIRVRAEERLLAARFGEKFHHYRRAVPAYIPLPWSQAAR
jgi:protein-S-isoprenylcysteine O-methyltransferase Ste14